MLQFSQYAPPPDLREWVRLVWTMTADNAPGADGLTQAAAPEEELVVPDGHAELIYNLGSPFQQQAPGDNAFRAQPSAILNGQLRGAVKLLGTGRVQLVGIRIQPWALGALARVSASSLTDAWQPVQSITAQLLPNLENALRESGSPSAAYATVVSHLRETVRTLRPPSSGARRVVSHIANSALSLDLSTVRHEMGLSERVMQRMFLSEVGLTAKQFTRVLRIEHAVQLRRLNPSATWARAAHSAGYYDQAHFNKDFRGIAGCAPTDLMMEPGSLTGSLLVHTEP